MGDQLPTMGDQLPTIGDRLPTMGDQLPTIGDRLPTIGDRLPTIGDQLPTIGYRLPTIGDRKASFYRQAIELPKVLSEGGVTSLTPPTSAWPWIQVNSVYLLEREWITRQTRIIHQNLRT